MAGGVAPMAMTDADRLHVFVTGNRGEIVTSEPVVGKLTDPEVRQYAQDMIRIHRGVVDRAMALDLDPTDNPVSMAMSQQAQGVAGKLSGMSGMALDQAYVDAQIVLHGQTLKHAGLRAHPEHPGRRRPGADGAEPARGRRAPRAGQGAPRQDGRGHEPPGRPLAGGPPPTALPGGRCPGAAPFSWGSAGRLAGGVRSGVEPAQETRERRRLADVRQPHTPRRPSAPGPARSRRAGPSRSAAGRSTSRRPTRAGRGPRPGRVGSRGRWPRSPPPMISP